MLNSLSIALYYGHEDVGTWSLLDLVKHRGIIAPNELGPDAFLKALGAIQMYHDRFHCFLRTGAAGELLNYVHFLLESLVSLTDAKSAPEFAPFILGSSFMGHERVVAALFQEDQTQIVVQDAGSDLAISYLDSNGQAPEYRLSPYFQGLKVDKRIWRDAAVEALTEYFLLTEELLHSRSEGRLFALTSFWQKWNKTLRGYS